MTRAALQLVESIPFQKREVQLEASAAGQAHSLHYAVPLPESVSPELIALIINKFSRKGEVVLDPFCGVGTVALEAGLLGRIPYACDTNPLFAKISQAKLLPAELTSITLALQNWHPNKPVDMSLYADYFSPFFDVQTYRELVQLKDFIQNSDSSTAKFLELIALGLLHGQSAGYFSTYTFSQISVRPEMQRELNKRRHQIPDYRSVVPRLLRRAASLSRDGLPSVLTQSGARSRIICCDPRNLNFIARPGVSLVLGAPPMPGDPDILQDLWLRLWFAGIPAKEVAGKVISIADETQWLDFMNSSLIELARVTIRGARAVFMLKPIKVGAEIVNLDDIFKTYIEENLSQYWEPEAALIVKQPSAKIKDRLEDRDHKKQLQRSSVLVLRRR